MNRPEDHQAHSLAGDAQVSCCCSVAKSFLTLCDLMDCSTPGYPVLHYLPEFAQIDSSVHGILQAKILEWVAFLSPGDLLDPEIKPRSPALQADS